MTYKPKVNDYVIWERHGLRDEGWVYFVSTPTEGYTEVDNINAVKLTKAQCDQVIQNLIADGVNPREIRAVKDN